jgi:hypothetical protein
MVGNHSSTSMKHLIPLLLLAASIVGCVKPYSYSRYANPCADSMFMSLKARNINDMTPREYDYFKTKQQECNTFQSSNEVADKVGSSLAVYYVVAAVGLIASLILISKIGKP